MDGFPKNEQWKIKDKDPGRELSATKEMNATEYEGHTYVSAQINGSRARAMIDSGANGNFISPEFVRRNNLPQQQKSDPYQLGVVDGTPIDNDANGMVLSETKTIAMVVNGHHERIQFDIVPIGRHMIILGKPWLRQHNPRINWKDDTVQFRDCNCKRAAVSSYPHVPRRNTDERKEAFPCLEINVISPRKIGQLLRKDPDSVHYLWISNEQRELATVTTVDKTTREKTLPEAHELPREYKEFRDLFEEKPAHESLPKHQDWDHEIPIEDGKKPGYGPIYSLNERELQELRGYIDENLKKGFIRPSTSPAGFPILFVPKKDGKLRLCVDYRKLNNITIKNRYPLPLISELQDRFQGAKWFSKFDVPGAYNLIRIKKGEEWKTAFRTRLGHYEYRVMPFGLTNAPATFQAYINSVLYEYLDVFVVVYIDDILVYTNGTLEQHIEHNKKVMSALRKGQLQLKIEKSVFHVKRIDFLGSIVTTNGIEMDPEKVRAIREWPTPGSVKEIQSFLGFANFYRRFIEGYSKIAEPLTTATKKCEKFQWTDQMQRAFNDLRQRFEKEPILVHYDPEKPCFVETDASDRAIGARVSQPDEKGRLCSIAYYSRKLTPAELNYDIHDKELLAIVASMEQWRAYLEGAKHVVTVYTDHKNLLYFTTTKVLNRRQVRWAETLATYNFRILYRKGSENTQADALSRRADYFQGKETVEYSILKRNQQGELEYNHTELSATIEIQPETWMKRIQNEYEKDTMAKVLAENKERNPRIDQDKETKVLTFDGLVYVPTPLREELVKEVHGAPGHGHQGVDKTIERLTRTYYFPGLRKVVERIIKECDTCAKSKHSRHAPYGQLQSIKAPTSAWEEIALDFIVKLPLSKDPTTGVDYDSILVITDRLTKYGYFIPYKEASTAESLMFTFLRTIVSNHGLPKSIISDRGSVFASKFWQSLTAQLGAKHKLSTAFHPQTDGQTERLNQTLEQYLRCYINYQQDNWVSLLPLAQFAYNSAKADTIGVSPFFANYGRNPELYREALPEKTRAQHAQITVEQLQKLHEHLSKDIAFLAMRSAKYYNQKRSVEPQLKEGGKAYLLRKNIKTKRPSDKLDHTKLGPFRITKVISPVNYELALPKGMRIHNRFHVSLLEPAPDNAKLQQQCETEETEPEYEVEKILQVRKKGRLREYLIKWKGYEDSENTWEPETHLRHCQEKKKEFDRGQRLTSQY